jgi:hypothetical protein
MKKYRIPTAPLLPELTQAMTDRNTILFSFKVRTKATDERKRREFLRQQIGSKRSKQKPTLPKISLPE